MHFDITSSNKLIVPGTDIVLTFTHASDAFRLHTSSDETPARAYFVEIAHFQLVVRRYTLTPELSQSIERQLIAGSTVPYHIFRHCISGPFEVSSGSSSFRQTLSLGQRPASLLVWQIDARAPSSSHYTPLNFEHFSLAKVFATFEGKQTPSAELSAIDFTRTTREKIESQDTLQHFRQLLRLSGCDQQFDNGLTFEEFLGGKTIIGIPLSEEQLAAGYVGESQIGSLSLTLEWETPLAQNILIYALGVFNDRIDMHPLNKLTTTSYIPGSFG